MTPLEILNKHWHYDSFRPMQSEIIDSVLGGHDTLAILPTGGGKSLCYQIPALASEGVTIVISPLIALMKDQVGQLRRRHIPAACIISGMHRTEAETILNNCIFGNIKLLYISPERLKTSLFLEHLRQIPVNLIAVDEAHCISQWGYDFRPEYLEIAKIRPFHPDAPLIALTATATPTVADDIIHQLEFRNGNTFKSSFLRPNLSYCAVKSDDKQGMLLRIARNVGGSGIVYVRNRRRTVELANMLNDNNIAALAYHAGIDIPERDKRQRAWLASHQGVMVATNAFGMGIDKPDVRFVVHLDIPESPEAYFQEAGRAGRDGKRAFAVIVTDNGDSDRLLQALDRDFPPLSYISNVYRAICNYYQIPVGAGQDSRFDFELDKICHTYNLDIYGTFTALKFLEREGLISLPDHSELQSRLMISVDKEELYRFQLSNNNAAAVLTATLRLYGGLFTDFTPVNEANIGRHCMMSELQVANTFKDLERIGIAKYIPKTLRPQIIFCTPRIDIKDLHISDRNYKDLKQRSASRRQAMVDYINNTDTCRSRQLSAYFGEVNAVDCQVCDVCIEHRKQQEAKSRNQQEKALHSQQDAQPHSQQETQPRNQQETQPHNQQDAQPHKPENLSDSIITLVASKPVTAKQLCLLLPQHSQELIASTVRRLLDNNTLTLNTDFTLAPAKR